MAKLNSYQIDLFPDETKNDKPDVDTLPDEIPAYQMTKAEIDSELAALKLERERIGLKRDRITQLEKERKLCTIQTALNTFNNFLMEFKDFILGLPDEVQTIVPTLSPAQYEALKQTVDIQIRRLHEKTITLTLEDTRTEAELSTDTKKESLRKANRLNGRPRDAKGSLV